jgi:hypothetical protein
MRWAVLILAMIVMANFSPEQPARAPMIEQVAQESPQGKPKLTQELEDLGSRVKRGEIDMDQGMILSDRAFEGASEDERRAHRDWEGLRWLDKFMREHYPQPQTNHQPERNTGK